MTEHVRKSYRNHRKTTWAGALVVLVLTALVIALPALAEETTPPLVNGVLPASDQKIRPSLANVGGSNFSCAKAGKTSYPSATPTPSGMQQFQISNPRPGTYTAPTGVMFNIEAPTEGDPKAVFDFSVEGGAAVVYHVGINGGTKTSWYDYVNNNPFNPAIAGDGVFSDKNVHSTPDSQYKWPSKPTFFAASHTTFCYVPLTVEPSCEEPFGPGDGFGGTSDAVQYSAQLVPIIEGQCKDENVVMFSYSPGGDDLVAQLSPVGEGDEYEVVERIRFTGIDSDLQNPITLKYDDEAPYDPVDDLLMCTSDPRDPDRPFELPGTGSHRELLPGPPESRETSCMLESSDSAGSGPNDRVYEAWIFSSVDGKRTG